VQTFYQPLFSNSPLAILLQQSLSLRQSFSLPKAPTSKSLPLSKSQKPQSKKPRILLQSFISSGKQGGAAVLRRCDIVTGETCFPAWEKQLFCISLFRGQGCASLGLQINILGKAAELHLALLMSGSHRPLIIRSPQVPKR
jgi:hypothetical protein